MTTTEPATQAPDWLNLDALGVRPDAAAYSAEFIERIDSAFEAVFDLLVEAQAFGSAVEVARLTVIDSARAWAPDGEDEDTDIRTAAGPMVDLFTGFAKIDEHLRLLSRLVHPDLVFAVCTHQGEQAFEVRKARRGGGEVQD